MPFELGLILFSLAIRIALMRFSLFDVDEARIFEMALEFYRKGRLPAHGALVMYTGTHLPGALLALLAGLPLWLSRGSIYGSLALIAALNTAGFWLIYRIYRKIFPTLDSPLLCAFILLNPWSFLMNNLTNPNYLPFFSALFLWGLLRLRENSGDPRGAFGLGLSAVAMLQLHLSVFALFALLIALWATGSLELPRVQALKALSLGALASGLPLVPTLLSSGAESATGDFLLSNLAINPDRPLQTPAFFLRFLRFPTGEVVRFLISGPGYPPIVPALKGFPILWPFFLITILGSLAIIGAGLWFYFGRRETWRSFRERTRLDFVFVALPVLTAVLFLFSIKGATAQAFWVLAPFSFYPALAVIKDARKRPPFFPMRGWRACGWAYVVSALTFSVVGFVEIAKIPRVTDALIR